MAAIGLQLAQMQELMEKNAAVVGTMSRRIDGLGSKTDTLSTGLGSIKSEVNELKKYRPSISKEEKDKNITCTICGVKGHRAADCPNKE